MVGRPQWGIIFGGTSFRGKTTSYAYELHGEDQRTEDNCVLLLHGLAADRSDLDLLVPGFKACISCTMHNHIQTTPCFQHIRTHLLTSPLQKHPSDDKPLYLKYDITELPDLGQQRQSDPPLCCRGVCSSRSVARRE